MAQSMFELPGKFYKGNLHTHSNNSDGALTPAEVCKRYADQGYDFISLTDHFVGKFNYPITNTAPFRTETFTTILGAELHSGAMSNGDVWHLLAVGLPQDFEPSNSPDFLPMPNQETAAQIAQRARDAGAFVAIAHPHWSTLTDADALTVEAAHAVEVYNHGCDVECDRGYGLQTLDNLLNAGRRLTLCATDDAHFIENDHFGGWVMVKAEENSPEALSDALKNGFHYSSQGPDFHNIIWNEDSVTVECSPCSLVTLMGRGVATSQKLGDNLTSVTLPFNRVAPSPWKRISIVDADGKRAWSNPFWKD